MVVFDEDLITKEIPQLAGGLFTVIKNYEVKPVSRNERQEDGIIDNISTLSTGRFFAPASQLA